MICMRASRSVDAAAAQLIAREAGGLVAFGESALEEAGLGLDQRYPLTAAAGERGMGLLRGAPLTGV